MTFAICQKCGAEKFGAVTHCPACDYCPMDGSDRDIALSMIFSDHYLDRKSLRALGHDIAAGVNVQVEEEAIDKFTHVLSQHLNRIRQQSKPRKKWWQFWKV